jgi:PAS domain S-box-containing protein
MGRQVLWKYRLSLYGRLTGIKMSEKDVTQEKEFILRLNEAVSNYRAATEYDLMKYKLTSDALGIALWDMDVVSGDPVNPGNKFTWSQEFRHMLGFNDEGDFPNILSSWSDKLHPEDKERTLNAFAAHISDNTGKTPYNIEYRLMLKNGQYRYFHAFGTTLRDDNGVPLRVAGALMDIDEKKQTQNQLMIMSSIVQNTPSFVSYKKIEGDCLYVNPAASVITGYTQEELMKDYIGALFNEETAQYISTKIIGNLRKTGITKYEVTGKIKNGASRIFAGTSFLIENDAFATIASDVTEAKIIETERLEALEQANAANKAKSEFLANMSHEIRTPINAITGMTIIGKSAADMKQAAYCFGRIEEASILLLGIINDILDMSKIEAKKFELSPSEFHFEKMLQKVINIFSFNMEKKRQKFKVNIDNTIPEVLLGDEQRLMQIITNLVGNAVKFTPEDGSIRIDTCFLEEKDGICTIQVMVTDSGIGISPEQQKNLFVSFQQAENSTSRKFGGSGLGLAITKNVIEMMGGKIWVESELGKGAIFAFTVQLKRVEGRDYNSGVNDEYEEGQNQIPQFAGRHLLLAEDVEINREIVLALLGPTLLDIDCALNGKEALSMFSKYPEKYDMIFMDVQMPEMDGYEATRSIRSLNIPNAKTIPIIAMTANIFKEDVEKCLESGMNGHIGKPLGPDEVLKQLRTYLT